VPKQKTTDLVYHLCIKGEDGTKYPSTMFTAEQCVQGFMFRIPKNGGIAEVSLLTKERMMLKEENEASAVRI
jgi:hypothetical protein